MFILGNLMVIYFIDQPDKILLGKYKYQHKFLYVNEGVGIVKLGHGEFCFVKGSLYAFRTAGFAEIISSTSLSAFLIVFNTIPSPDRKVLNESTKQLQIVDKVIKLMPINAEVFEHRVTTLNDQESIADLLKMIQREMNTQMEHSDEIILNNALNIIRIAVRVEAQPARSRKSLDPSSGVLEIMGHIRTILKENKKTTIVQIATSLNTTSWELNRLFIKNTGITISDYLREIRKEQ